MITIQTTEGDASATRHDIVVGVDGSEESYTALHWALRQAALSGQRVNAVFATAGSPVFSQGDDATNAAEELLHRQITERVLQWNDVSREHDDTPTILLITSVRASSQRALLDIGDRADQIVVGRRSLGQVTRWFIPSVSSSIVEQASVPVTVVRTPNDDEDDIEKSIARILTGHTPKTGNSVGVPNPPSPSTPVSQTAIPSDTNATDGRVEHKSQEEAGAHAPDDETIVVGVDGSQISEKALRFAWHAATLHHVPLYVLFCWQLQDLGVVPGYENAVPPISAGQKRAEEIVRSMVGKLPDHPPRAVSGHALHIPAGKGLITASHYATRIIVGSRGLSGLNAHFLESVSRQIVNLAECTVTVVH